MSLILSVKIKASKGSYEGTVSGLPGLAPTKLQKADGSTKFATRKACEQAAAKVSLKMACGMIFEDNIKQAAKKALKVKTKKSPTITTPAWLQK